jgi:hypothetical protein
MNNKRKMKKKKKKALGISVVALAEVHMSIFCLRGMQKQPVTPVHWYTRAETERP